MGVVAAHLQVPLNKLKVVGGTVGGGFGGKVDTATETMCALLAHEVGQAGEVALDARGGVPLLVDAGAVAHGDRGRGDEGRLDPRPQDADAARRGRVLALLAVRPHEAQLPPHGRVLDPEPRVRRLRRLHEPHADDRHARLRRHVGLVRDRDAHEPHRARSSGSIRTSSGSRTRTGSATRRRTRSSYTDPSTVPTIQAIADAVGHELTPEYKAMTREQRERRPPPGAPRRPARKPGGPLMAMHDRPRVRGDRVPDGDEPERRPVAGVDQGQAGRARRRLRRHVRHRQRLEDDPVADRGRDDRRPLRVDHVRQLEHRLVAGLHGHVRLPRDVRRRQGGREGGRERARRRSSRSRARSSRSTRPTSRSSTAR